jgi:hypothetical protein
LSNQGVVPSQARNPAVRPITNFAAEIWRNGNEVFKAQLNTPATRESMP